MPEADPSILTARGALCIRGLGGERRQALYTAQVSVGRGQDNVVVLADPKVSREHLVLDLEADGARFRDLGSQNGTFLAGERVESGFLRNGETLALGSTTLELQVHDACAQALEALLRIEDESALDPVSTDLVERVLEASIACTHAERGFVLTVHPTGMRMAAARGLDRDEIPLAERELSWSLAIRVATGGEDLVTEDALADARVEVSQSIESLGLRSVLCVPVRTRGGIAAVIYVEHRGRRGAFGEVQRIMLRLLANRAAVAFAAREVLSASEERRKLAEARTARQTLNLAEQRRELEAIRGPQWEQCALVGSSALMRELRSQIERMAVTDLPVLIWGASSTGKELAARMVHQASPRAQGPFTVIACAAVPESLLEHELFGHERGAFTGAEEAAPGLFEAAHGGTLVLDGIECMSMDMQSRLLRVIEAAEVRRLGGKVMRAVDVRLVSILRENPLELVRAHRLREDLYYRLRVLEVAMPALRAHPEDIPEIALALLQRNCGAAAPELSACALAALATAPWPGQVRELENTLRRACLGGSALITAETLDLPRTDTQPLLSVAGQAFSSLTELVDDVERRQILGALRLHDNNKTAAARALGITRFTLQRRLERLGINA